MTAKPTRMSSFIVMLVSSLIAGVLTTSLSVNSNTVSRAQSPQHMLICERNSGIPCMVPARVSALAAAHLGKSPAPVTEKNCLLITDRGNPLVKLEKRSAWEVPFDGVDIAVQFAGEPKLQNKNIHKLTAVIDDQTGALLKVYSPKPRVDGLLTLSARSLQTYQAITMKPTTTAPKMSLLQVLKADEPEITGIMEAKEIVAYYGLVSQTPPTRINNIPCWVVFIGGIHQPFASAGPAALPGLPPGERNKYGRRNYGNEAFIVINANTGKFLASHMTGPPLQQQTQ